MSPFATLPRISAWQRYCVLALLLLWVGALNAHLAPREVVFIDPGVADWQVLRDGVKPGVEVVVLNGTGDGLAQMAEWARGRSGYDAIHLLSHGSPGTVHLGALDLNRETLGERAGDLATLGAALDENGDLLLYGCNVAAGQTGADFVQRLARVTGADVAASEDLTGSTATGGDWYLEYVSGAFIPTAVMSEPTLMAYRHSLATFMVNSTADSGLGTLRDAAGRVVAGDTIQFANSINNGTITLSSSLALNSNITLDASPLTTLTITGSVIDLLGGLTVTNGPGGSLSIGSTIIEGVPDSSITKTGAGTLTLSGINHVGIITVLAGTLSTDSLGNTFSLTLMNGSTLKSHTAALAYNRPVTLGNGGGTIDLSNGPIILGGLVSGGGALTIDSTNGGNSLELYNNNIYSGGTILNNGILTVGSDTAAGTGTLTINGGEVRNMNAGATRTLANDLVLGGTFTMSGSGALTFNGNVDLGGANRIINRLISANLTFGGIVSNGDLTINSVSAGVVILAGPNSYTDTTINAGTLSVAAAANLGTGLLTLNGGILSVTDATTLVNPFMIGSGHGTISNANDIILSGPITGPGNLTKTGAGKLTLAGLNSYNGTTTVSGGYLSVASDSNLGAGAVSLAGGWLVITETTTIDNAVILSATVSVIDVTSGKIATLFGPISETGSARGFNKSSGGTLVLAGTASYTGNTVLNGGTVRMAAGGSYATASIIINNSLPTLEITGDGTFDRTVNVNKSGSFLNADTVTLSGALTGAGALTKTGAGTLTLPGANTHSGAITVAAGTLGGAGTLTSSNVTVNPGGTLAPGVPNGIGLLIINGNLTLAGTLAVDITGTAPPFTAGTDYDQVMVSGTVTLTPASAAISVPTYTVTGGSNNTFVVVNNTGGVAIAGTLAGVPEGGNFTSNGRGFGVSYVGGTGSNDLTLTVDTTAPTVQSVSAPANGTYKIGQDLDFIATFSEAVTISGGAPSIALTLDTGGTVQANLFGTVTNIPTATFRYTVVSGNLDANGIGAAATISANGATIRDAANNAMTDFTFTAPDTTSVLVDGVRPGKAAVNPITASDADSSGTYTAGDTLTLSFTEAVDATKIGNLTLSGHSLGATFGVNPNIGTATSFIITLGTGATVVATDTLTLTAVNVVDQAGNQAAASVVFTVPALCEGAALTVTTPDDSGAGSLRQAITDVCPGGTITFASNLAVQLTTAELAISKNLEIDGTGHTVSVNGPGVGCTTCFRVFNVSNSANLTLQNLTVANGAADFVGGGLYNNGGTVTVTNTTVSGNSATLGGGLYNDGGTVTVTNTTVSGNSAQDGGGLYNNGGTARANLTNTTFSGNSATGAFGVGGGLVNGSGTVMVTNTTFSGNSATGASGVGGGLANGGTATLTNTTFSGNSATNGGGLFNVSGTGTVSLKNTLLAGNTTGGNCSGAITNSGNNLDDGTSCGFTTVNNSLSSTDPLLGALDYYGGTGTTKTFPLLPGSPAIDAGTNTGCPVTDQRGITRTTCDIGAFESQGFVFTKTGGDNQSATISTAFASPLAVSVTATGSGQVNGGAVTFTPPVTGASAVLVGSPVTIASGAAQVTATANATVGSYSVAASAAGATAVNFSLANNTPTPINGACGSASGQSLTSIPTSNLCSVGTASTVSGSGPWTWSCAGSGGGSTALCSAGAGGGIHGNQTQFNLNSGAGCTVDSVNLIQPPNGGPPGLTMPFGAVSFHLSGCTGSSATIQITYPGTVAGMQYWKYIGSGWRSMPASLVGNTATFTIVDNDGTYDADSRLGYITDPGGPSVTAGAGGAASIPTLSEWALMLFSLLLGGLVWRQRAASAHPRQR